MNNDAVFRYSYSAKQNEEVQAIRNKYISQPESKLDELKRLDQCVHNAGMARSLAVGILGCLVFGLGMCFAMKVIGQSAALGSVAAAVSVVSGSAATKVVSAGAKAARDAMRKEMEALKAETSSVAAAKTSPVTAEEAAVFADLEETAEN